MKPGKGILSSHIFMNPCNILLLCVCVLRKMMTGEMDTGNLRFKTTQKFEGIFFFHEIIK